MTILLAGCGGASMGDSATPRPASTLQYKDPEGGGWRLVKDERSTPSLLVLDLVGPAGQKARGVGLTLQGDLGLIRFAKLADGLYLKSTGVFELTTNHPDEPKLIASSLRGNQLTLGLFQKEARKKAKDCGTVLLQCAIEIQPQAQITSSTPVALSVVKAHILPEDSPASGSTAESITISVGWLVLE